MGLLDRLTFIARAEKTAYEKNQAAKHGLTPEHVPFLCMAEYTLPVRYEFSGLLDAAFSEKVATSIGVSIMKAVMFPEKDSQGNEITALLMEFVSTTEDELQYAVKELFEYNRMGAAEKQILINMIEARSTLPSVGVSGAEGEALCAILIKSILVLVDEVLRFYILSESNNWTEEWKNANMEGRDPVYSGGLMPYPTCDLVDVGTWYQLITDDYQRKLVHPLKLSASSMEENVDISNVYIPTLPPFGNSLKESRIAILKYFKTISADVWYPAMQQYFSEAESNFQIGVEQNR